MRSISAEDNDDTMRYNRNIAAVLLVAATIITLSTSLYITSATVSDADPSTYVVVPLLMLPLFLLFSLKSRPEPKVNKRSAIFGAAAFALFIVLAIVLRLYFSIFFISFRIDMLLMPLALFALVSLTFGTENVRRFRAAIAYSLLASPAVLLPLLLQSGAFVQLNTLIVYGLLKPFVAAVQYSAPITISANGYSIGIGQTCVSLGIFVALALFLIPLAFFFNGKMRDKAKWVSAGILLLFLLNIARMLGISMVWLDYGPNATALLIHNFIGVILFYAVIVVMILISRFFGLGIARASRARSRARSTKVNVLPIAAAFAFSIIYLLITFNYSTALAISPMALQHVEQFNYSNNQTAAAVQGVLTKGKFIYLVIANSNATSIFATLTNNTINSTNALLLIMSGPNSNTLEGLSQNNRVLGERRFFNARGAEDQVIDLISNNTEFLVYNTNLALSISNSSEVISGTYLVIPAVDLPKYSASCMSYDWFYSLLFNALTPSNYNQTVSSNILSAQCLSYNLLWR